jgi:5-methylcytosine-specific restriction endonuclease McrA
LWTAAEWLALKHGTRHIGCFDCWKTEAELKLLNRKLVPDHIVPVSKGGLNIIENLQPLCHGVGGCNNKKFDKIKDFMLS